MKDFLAIAQERGYIKDVTDIDGISSYAKNKNAAMYVGFDCTAPSLHIGSLIQIMLLRLWQKCGNRPIILLGGGTTKIGDPSGKDKARKIFSYQEIESNTKTIGRIFAKFVDFENNKSNNAIIVNNDEWLNEIKYIDFLRDYGAHFSVNKMLSLESIKQRIERQQELSFIEFNYVLMQSYDFVKLNETYNCRLQSGGSDQWGNIVNGIELNRKMGKERCYGITTPLLTTSSGQKMGKTENGAVWLDSEFFSAYDYWQYFRNTDDSDVGRFLRLFTELPINEIQKLESLKDAEINEAKKILANEATTLCHGQEESKKALQIALQMFESSEKEEKIYTFKIKAGDELYLKQIIHSVGFAPSVAEAKRLIKSNAVSLDNTLITDENYKVSSEKFNLLLSVGKKKKISLLFE